MSNTVSVTEQNNTVTVTESNNTVTILEDAPIVTPEPWYADLPTLPTTSGTATVTADNTPHTKGAWTEIIASNGAATQALMVQVTEIGQSGTDTATLIDIGVGAAGNETAIASDIAVSGASNSGIVFALPVAVAQSARISVRSQAVIPSDTADVTISSFVIANSAAMPTTVDVLGSVPAASTGTEVLTSYTEIIASTSQAYEAIAIVESLSRTAFINYFFNTVTVGIGAAGVEVDVAQKPHSTLSSERTYSNPTVSLVTAVDIPAGSRIAAKASPYFADVVVIGIPAA